MYVTDGDKTRNAFALTGTWVRIPPSPPRRSKVRFAPFFYAEKYPPVSLLLLFREKPRSHRLTACKRAVLTPICPLPTFRECAPRRKVSFLSGKATLVPIHPIRHFFILIV